MILVAMRVLVLANPISGRGRGLTTSMHLDAALREAGHDVERLATRPDGDLDVLRAALAGHDVLVVAGGDGAVRDGCIAAAGTGVAVYHAPCGTENLFAREWRMDATPQTLLRALERRHVVRVDIGMLNALPFILMASVGFDAAVIEDLAASRRGAITHRSYLGPLWRQWQRWRPRCLRVEVDGERIDDDRPGLVVVGNSRQYALRMDPALRADMTDGCLDVVFLPTASRLELLRWIAVVRSRRHVLSGPARYECGQRILIEADDGPVRFQLDGECPPPSAEAARLDISVRPGAVGVLVPDR